MPGMERQPQLDIAHTTDILPGDYFFLCSDEEKRQILIQTSKSSADNHSAYLIHIVSVEGETDDHRFLNDEGNVRSNALLLDGVNKNQTSSPTLFHRIISIFCKRHHSL